MDDTTRFNMLRKALLVKKPECEIDAHTWTQDAGLQTRIVNGLMNEGYRTLDDAVAILTMPELPCNFGKKCWLVVHDNLKALGKI